MASRCLVVANEPLEGERLDYVVNDCLTRAVRRFYVVVPLRRVRLKTITWTEGVWMPAERRAAMDATWKEDAFRRETALDQESLRARHRLDRIVDRIHSAGGEAEGEVGTVSPLESTRLAIQNQAPFTEVLVATSPSGISRWVAMDLPSRVTRITDIPVSTIAAAKDAPNRTRYRLL